MLRGISSIFAGGGLPYRVTIGVLGSPFFYAGYTNNLGGSDIGSINAIPDINGDGLLQIYGGYGAGGPDLVVMLDDLDSNGAATDFTSIIIEDGDGVIRTYLTADATFTNSAGVSSKWEWGTGSDEVWGNVDSGETRGFSIIV